MKKFYFFRITAVLLLAGTLFAACEKTPSKKKSPEVEPITAFDDMDFFQRAFVNATVATETTESYEIGETISFTYSMGEPLDENDPTNLFIGVKNLNEALAYWDACLAPDITRTTSATNDYTYTFTDLEGKSQGTVNFKAGVDGNVAVITPKLSGLQYFTKVTFILNSAWEAQNGPSAEPRNRLGDIRTFSVPEIGDVNFVCIRERSNGVKPFYAAISTDKYGGHSSDMQAHVYKTKWCPAENKAKIIYNLLHTDWDFFVAVFEEAGGGKLDVNEACWIDGHDRYPFSEFQHGINLTADKIEHALDRWDTYWRQPKKRVLLKVDWLDEDALYYIPGANSGGYTEEEAENLFDGQKGTKWCVGRGRKTEESIAFSGKKCWFVEFETMEPEDSNEYTIMTADSAKDRYGRNPKEWALLGKKQSSGEWTVLDKRTDVDLPHKNSASTDFQFNVTTDDKDWKYFRLEVTDIQGGEKFQCMQFSTFKFK